MNTESEISVWQPSPYLPHAWACRAVLAMGLLTVGAFLSGFFIVERYFIGSAFLTTGYWPLLLGIVTAVGLFVFPGQEGQCAAAYGKSCRTLANCRFLALLHVGLAPFISWQATALGMPHAMVRYFSVAVFLDILAVLLLNIRLCNWLSGILAPLAEMDARAIRRIRISLRWTVFYAILYLAVLLSAMAYCLIVVKEPDMQSANVGLLDVWGIFWESELSLCSLLSALVYLEGAVYRGCYFLTKKMISGDEELWKKLN